MIEKLSQHYSDIKSYIEREEYDKAMESFRIFDQQLRQFFDQKNNEYTDRELTLLTEIDNYFLDNISFLSTEKAGIKSKLSKLTKGKTGVNAYIGNAVK